MSAHSRALELTGKYPFFSLIQPGSVIGAIADTFPADEAGPGMKRRGGSLGNLTGAYPEIVDLVTGEELGISGSSGLGGAGADEVEELALVRAVAETAERYACCVHSPDKVVVATANELGDDALAFGDLLRCSPQEYANPRCPLRPFDAEAPIRWIKGYSLTARKERLVPLIMTHLYVKPWESEMIWNSISTGVAAHTDPVKAIVSGISEVVERDALTLAWLLRLPLPRILFDEDPPADQALKFQRLQRSKVRSYFYNATTDIGVPTVYGLQLTDRHAKISQFVGCSSGLSMWENCAKVIRECAAGRTMGSSMAEPPANFDDFVALEHGAAFMGRPEQRHHFDFLTKNGRTELISAIKTEFPDNAADQFKFLIKRFTELNMDVVLVDLTTDELRDAGLWVIRAVIPALVPLTFVHQARFLGHPRIYDYARKMGLNIHSDADINTLPQPFA